MRKAKKYLNAVLAVLVFVHVFSLEGCGKKENDIPQEDYGDYTDIEGSERDLHNR